jgi:hypothetical protein
MCLCIHVFMYGVPLSPFTHIPIFLQFPTFSIQYQQDINQVPGLHVPCPFQVSNTCSLAGSLADYHNPHPISIPNTLFLFLFLFLFLSFSISRLLIPRQFLDSWTGRRFVSTHPQSTSSLPSPPSVPRYHPRPQEGNNASVLPTRAIPRAHRSDHTSSSSPARRGPGRHASPPRRAHTHYSSSGSQRPCRSVIVVKRTDRSCSFSRLA